MVLIALKCPNCNGDIQLDDNNEFGFCMYCGSKVLLERQSSKVSIDYDVQIKNSLKMAKEYIENYDFAKAEKLIETILINDYECSDAYFMKALLSMSNDEQYEKYYQKANDYINNNMGVFTESTLDELWGSDVYILLPTKRFSEFRANLDVDGKFKYTLSANETLHFGLREGSRYIELSYNLVSGNVYRYRIDFVVNEDSIHFLCKFKFGKGMILVRV